MLRVEREREKERKRERGRERERGKGNRKIELKNYLDSVVKHK